MKAIREKLKGEEGSSLIIAVLILLICTVLGGIVLSAASANMSRIKRNRDEQQAYLTAESAVLMFRELFLQEEIQFSVQEDGTWEVDAKKTDDFTAMLCNDIEKILDGTSVEGITKSLELSGEEALGDQKVTASYRMNLSYGIELSIQVASEGKVLSNLAAEFPAVSHTQDGVTGLTWNKGTITRLAEAKKEAP